MLADEVDYVVGVDPHRDRHALAIVCAATGVAVFETEIAASELGYRQALRVAEREASGRRAWAIEGTGSYGAGLARCLAGRGERVLEVGRTQRVRRSHAKTDPLDALRAARTVLAQTRLASPRAAGEREALRALMVTRAGALTAKKAGLCQLRALLVTCPEPLRRELRSLTQAQLLRRLAAIHPDQHEDAQLRGTLIALRALSVRVQMLAGEEREHSARSRRWSRGSRQRYSRSQGSAQSQPRNYSSPGRTQAASATTPPSPVSPAPHQSPPAAAKRSATDSTPAATDNSTAPCTQSSSPDENTTQPRSATSHADKPKEKASATASAVSSATSPATSTAYSRPHPP